MRGAQRPRISHVPDYASSTGREAIEFCRSIAGLDLDPWQEFVLAESLGERGDGRWAAFEVGLVVPRQNGKGAVLEARELVGLFLLGERLIIHSAHEFATSMEAFLRMDQALEASPDLSRRVRTVSRSHGSEGFTLKNGQRLRYRTRTKGGGRGFSCNCLILDEAMILPESAHSALLPTLSAQDNPQVWYTGSAVDQTVHEDGIVLTRVRERGSRGSPGLAYFEWSVPFENPADVDPTVAASPEAWAQANPGFELRIREDSIANEMESFGGPTSRGFVVERLGVGDWPQLDNDGSVISVAKWLELTDIGSKALDPVVFALDIAPDRSFASIGVAGSRGDGKHHVEVVERAKGTEWVVARAVELNRHRPRAFVVDGVGPAGGLIPLLEEAGVTVTTVGSREQAQACGLLFDAVEQQTLRHLGTGELTSALRGAAKRPLSDAWAWSRKTSTVDISPLVACTLAYWGAVTLGRGGVFVSAW